MNGTMHNTIRPRGSRLQMVLLGLLSAICAVHGGATLAQSGNRLTYLDEFLDPYYVHRSFPKLTTPQWVGEPGVEAVVVLAIDDMRDTARYEAFLRPILERLKQIDGRAALSIMTCRVDPADPQLAAWLKEGVSIEVHTYDHPCPCLQGGNFAAAKETYEKCVDLMADIPGNRPVAFRMPCCDSLNTPSPRFWAEIFNRTTARGRFLSIDSSVFQIFTSDDDQLPRAITRLPDGRERFRVYLPFPSFVNTIENYPYPYVIGRLCWQFPCMVPSDWEAQNIQKPNNPDTVRDMKLALDATVLKQGVFNLVFHPHNWIRNDQIVELIDHAVQSHGTKVKFLSFREAQDRLDRFLLGGVPLRDEHGRDNGVRLVDLNDDGFLDVVIGNDRVRQTRIWNPASQSWDVSPFPAPIVVTRPDGQVGDAGVRFGILDGHDVVALARGEHAQGAWRWQQGAWVEQPELWSGLEEGSNAIATSRDGKDLGVRLRDLDRDGTCELLVANPRQHAVYRWGNGAWHPWFAIPEHAHFTDELGRDAGLRVRDIDGDGLDDLLFSNEQRYGLFLMRRSEQGELAGWTLAVSDAPRSVGDAIPMITRQGTNNGAWFHSNHLWVQNEDTQRLPDLVDRRSFRVLLGEQANMPPPRSPDASLKSMRVPEGLRIDLVAAEPLIADPIAFDWGPDGRLWVLEMGDYPLGLPDKKPGGRLKVLTDDNGDGRYDRADLFLDDLHYPTGLKVWKNGVLVLAAPELFYAEDRDGDGRADTRETLYRGFVEGNQQHRANGLRWGLDGWLYIANGDSGGTIASLKTGQRLSISGRDLRIEPDSGAMEAESGQTQYGRNRDDWDHWFGGNNSHPIWHYVLSDRWLRRNPHWPAPDTRREISEVPGAAPVYPISYTLARFNDFNMADRFTSACSPEIYRDVRLGDTFYGNAFICEPVHNLVHREVVTRDGVTFRGQRAASEKQSEFLASEDNWFRPVMIRTGPDGGLWIADMYRLVIEHPEWIPATWQKKLDLRAGADRGRIYRIRAASGEWPAIPRLDRMSPSELAAQMHSTNGWVRDMAQQLLTWRKERSVASDLEQQVRAASRATTRGQALATLDTLNALTPELLCAAMEDRDPNVRMLAARIASRHVKNQPAVQAALERVGLRESDPAVLLEIVSALGECGPSRLGAIALRLDDMEYGPAAFAGSLRSDNLAPVTQDLFASPNDGRAARPPKRLVEPLVRFAAATKQTDVLETVLHHAVATQADDASAALWRLRILGSILEVLTPELRNRLSDRDRDALGEAFESIRALLANAETPADIRYEAALVLGRVSWNRDALTAQFESLLTPRQPLEIQTAAIEGLARMSDDRIADILLADWPTRSPALRTRILDTLLSRPNWTRSLLAHIADGSVPASQLNATLRRQLREHPSAEVREQAEQLFRDEGSSDRKAVLEQFAMVPRLTPNPANGRALFKKHCSTCHVLEGEGHAVGPDLTALSDKSIGALLVAVLDPNRAVEDKFLEYVALLNDGRQVRGMLANEATNSLTLIGQEAKRVDVLRSDLEMLVATGKSLMPEGLEKDIGPQELADLLGYVRSVDGTPKRFPGNEPKLPRARDDGSIRLPATDCRIYGPTVVFEQTYRNLGYWGSPDDRAVWDVEVPKAGTYRVSLDYACHNDTAGNRFRLEIGDQILGGTVEGTGTWDHYRTRTVGEVVLPAGRTQVTFRSDGPLHGMLIDLRGIVLAPK